jgi:phage shock protein A
MAWIQTFKLVMRSNITALRDVVEDPERMLHQLIIDMEEEHQRVRESVAGAIADEILLKKKVDKARVEADEWLERAASALRSGSEDQSRAALEHKASAARRASDLEAEHLRQKEQTAQLQRAVKDLEDKIRQARQKQTLLLARLTRAESQQKIDRAMAKVDSRSAFTQFERMEARVDRAEAMTEAFDRLDGKDPDAEQLRRQFEDRERKEELEKEFAELKGRVDAGA